jgi:glycosyltransferase A (GT-A) superfamily protein (DUF2064 family)
VRPAVALVMAKSPIAGRVKTRLGREVGMDRAAELAAAALLDTVEACAAAYGVDRCHLALDGDLAQGALADELLEATAAWVVHPQNGQGLAERLVHAHTDVAAYAGAAVVQVGMDTPQLRVDALLQAADLLDAPDRAVLGPAHDGGWWLLGVTGPHLLRHLAEVPMSTHTTGALTRRALQRAGARVTDIGTLRDVDEAADAQSVADASCGSRFARSWG